jgi:hypothetical protein
MSVASFNWIWEQGSDLVMSMIYREGPLGEEVPVDLSDYSLRMDVFHSGNRVFTFNSDDIAVTGVDVVGPADNEVTLGADGTIKIIVPRSVTLPGGAVNAVMTANKVLVLQYDIFLRDNDGLQRKFMKGTITVNPSYTLWQ